MKHYDQQHKSPSEDHAPEGPGVLKVGDRSQRTRKSRPLEGARQRPATSVAGGASVFVIARKGADFLDSPVFHAGESGEEEAVAVFTARQGAQAYLDRAGWAQAEEVGELSPDELARWLTDASGDGVRYAAVNPDREKHLGGEPQAVLSLNGLSGRGPDSVFQELTALARG